jgi:5-(carboxyamino)imidazole ribonucleotide synthase
MMNVTPPNSVIGIVGGGQLGRMLATAATELGYKVHIFSPEQGCPASQAAWRTTTAPYDDEVALAHFADSVDVVTFEFENIPHASLTVLEEHVPVYPSPELLKISQNRLREKNFINAQEIATADYHRVTSEEELQRAIQKIGVPSILKTTELGYDGKGQVTIHHAEDALSAWQEIGKVEAVLEKKVDFIMEISVIVARGVHGQSACYVPVQNIHKNHILDRTIAPAAISKELISNARHIALTLAKAANLRGVLAVEMFVTRENQILVNELAPRPHNSGHWTMDGCITSQFEQSIRAICGLPLGSTERLCEVEMRNLIGAEVEKWEEYLKQPHAKLHLYGKKEARAGRKMGHVNLLKPQNV